MIQNHNELVPDTPSVTHVATHGIDVGDAQPIRQHPYRLNPEKLEHLKNEVDYMLENEIIEPSQGNWSCMLYGAKIRWLIH